MTEGYKVWLKRINIIVIIFRLLFRGNCVSYYFDFDFFKINFIIRL